ncbi:hypothetical protein P7C70_g3697, partial [Phenoliferia sp. Uapishka_3]
MPSLAPLRSPDLEIEPMTPFQLDCLTPSYHQLSQPHPSHPALSNYNPSHQQPIQPFGALSALSAILGSAPQPQQPPTKGPSALLARRRAVSGQVDEGFSLGVDLEHLRAKPARWPKEKERASKKATTSAKPMRERDGDVPLFGTAASEGLRGGNGRGSEGDEEDLPPSPVGFPGAWTWDGKEKSALLLPPPFLDEKSSRDSFDGLSHSLNQVLHYTRLTSPSPGLLGARQARLAQTAARKASALYARDRPPPPIFPHSLLSTASKLISALGPPGGLDSESLYRKWKEESPENGESRNVRKDRRALERAESSLGGFELGERVMRGLGERLRGGLEKDKAVGDEARDGEPTTSTTSATNFFRPATPLSLFLPPPLSAFTNSPLPSPFLPSLSGTPLFDSSSSTLTADSLPLLTPSLRLCVPPKPKLAPTFTDAEPSPFPLATPSVFDEGYFSLRQRRRRSPNPKPGLDAQPSIAHPSIPPHLPSSQPGSPIPGTLFTTVREPFRQSLSVLDRFTRPHLEFITWVLVGSLSASTPTPNIGGIFGLTLHLFGFLYFLLIHTLSLLLSTYLTLRSISFFLHWTWLNISGRTDLSVAAREYWRLSRREWDLVKEEDGVALGIWSVGLGLVEMALIQAMSQERWIADEERLKLLNGDKIFDGDSTVGKEPTRPIARRRSTRLGPGSDRPGLGRRKTTRTWTEDDGEGDSLLVTGSEGAVLEGTILNSAQSPALAALSPSFTGLGGLEDDELPPLDLGDSLPGISFSEMEGKSAVVSEELTSPELRPVPENEDPLLALLKTLKRHVRLATASYGLHSYLITPPSPLFTPSGANIPSRIFSHLGGIGRDNVLHVAIQKDYVGVPSPESALDFYAPQFYLLRDDLHSEIVCVIRGTQSLADIQTDLEASLEDVRLPSLDSNSEDEEETFRAHAGIFAAARKLLDSEHSPLFSKLRTVLEEHPGYSLVLTGHSLGAAIASSLAILIGQYETSTSSPTSPTKSTCESGRWKTSPASGLPPDRPIRAICFAHPTTVDVALSLRCSLGEEPLVLSISLSSDVVTRMGIPQVREVRRTLGRLASSRRGIFSGDGQGRHGWSEVLRTWWEWKSLGGGVRGAEIGKREEVERIEEKAWRWRTEMDGELGRAVDQTMLVPAGRSLHLDRLPAELEKKRKKDLEEEADEEEEAETVQVWGLYEVAEPGSFYSCPILDAELVKSHLPKEYLDAIDAL